MVKLACTAAVSQAGIVLALAVGTGVIGMLARPLPDRLVPYNTTRAGVLGASHSNLLWQLGSRPPSLLSHPKPQNSSQDHAEQHPQTLPDEGYGPASVTSTQARCPLPSSPP